MKFLILSLFVSSALAIDLPQGGVDVRGEVALQASASATAGKVESLEIGKRLTIAKAHPAKAYSAQFTAPVSESV